MTREERLDLLKQIEKDIYVPSIESTFLEDAKSCAIHSVIEELEQEPCDVFDEYGNYKYPSDVELTEPNTATSMPCEDEYIKVPKKALKYRTAGMVAYNAEWLKNHFDIERAVICGAQEPCEDADMKLIHTQGLDEGIRCAMCTNSMANDKGCDGGCVVNEVMYKRILDVIRKHIIDGDEL